MPLWSVVLLIVFVVLLCFPVGMGNNNLAAVATVCVFVGVPLIYFVPTINAVTRSHPRRTAIIVVNLFLGWTLVGWVVALAWSYAADPPPAAASASPPAPTPEDPFPSWRNGQPATVGETKKCPFCAEDVKAAAIKCKHCGSDLADRGSVKLMQ